MARSWNARVAGFALAASLAAGPAFAEPECHPVAPEMVAKVWADFAAQDDVAPAAGNDGFECAAIARTLSTACRTLPSHPAHPSVVVRRITRGHGGWWMNTEGTTAGACGPFLAMLRAFDALTDQMREQLARERAEKARQDGEAQ